MKVFVTGVNGYIGAVLGPYLMERGLTVRGLDTGYYRDGWLFSDNTHMRVQPFTINKDLRDISAEDIEGCEAIAHLAELSNDPLGQNNPRSPTRSTTRARWRSPRPRAAPASRASCIPLRAACTGPGPATSSTRPRHPIRRPPTPNARRWSSATSARWRGRDFCPVFLRNATAYGPSPRMRFDIVLNDLCALAWTTKRIAMMSDGSPWRPVVHVEDICEAIYRSLIAPADAVRGKIFNVGANSRELPGTRARARSSPSEFPGCEVTRRRQRAATSAAIASTSTASTASCRASSAATPRAMAREQLRELFERIQMSTGDVCSSAPSLASSS